jgi:hypothetical protein
VSTGGLDCEGLALCSIDTHAHTGRVEETMRQMQEHRGVLATLGLLTQMDPNSGCGLLCV